MAPSVSSPPGGQAILTRRGRRNEVGMMTVTTLQPVSAPTQKENKRIPPQKNQIITSSPSVLVVNGRIDFFFLCLPIYLALIGITLFACGLQQGGGVSERNRRQ